MKNGISAAAAKGAHIDAPRIDPAARQDEIDYVLDGKAEEREIYAPVEPRRKSPNPYWRDKTIQVMNLEGVFDRVDEKRWRLAA